MLTYAFITGIVALLAAVLLLGFGLRGRRVNDHVVCAKCRFDLEGVYPGAEAGAEESGGAGWRGRCPECGRELVGPRCVKRGVRERSRGMLAGAGVCAAVFVGAGALVANQARQQGFNVYEHKPVWLLALEGEGPWPTVANAALSELVDRQTNGQLADRQEAALIRRALEYQGDVDRVWRTGWGLLIENAIVGGRLSEADTKRYARQAVVVEVAARERVRIGDPFPAELRVEQRMAPHSILWYAVFNDGAMLGDEPILARIRFIYRGREQRRGFVAASASPPVTTSPLTRGPVDQRVMGVPGPRELATRWIVFVGIDGAIAGRAGYTMDRSRWSSAHSWDTQSESAEWSDDPEWAFRAIDLREILRLVSGRGGYRIISRSVLDELEQWLVSWRIEHRSSIQIVDSGDETVRMVHEGAELLEVEALLRSLSLVRAGTPWGFAVPEPQLWLESSLSGFPPIALVFDVIARDGDAEHPMGTMSSISSVIHALSMRQCRRRCHGTACGSASRCRAGFKPTRSI